MEDLVGQQLKLPPRDGFDLVVSLELDDEGKVYDRPHSDADVASWNKFEWCYVGVVVTAYRDGDELGHAVIWGCAQGTIGNGARIDTLGRGGVFQDNHELLVTEAIAHAIDTLRLTTNDEIEAGGQDYELSVPTIEKPETPADASCPWLVTWPDGQTSTYKQRQRAERALMISLRDLWRSQQ